MGPEGGSELCTNCAVVAEKGGGAEREREGGRETEGAREREMTPG
jgi:hypothetical protein